MNEADRIRELTRHLLDRTKETDILREALARLERKLTDMAGWFPLDNLAKLALDARDALDRAKGNDNVQI